MAENALHDREEEAVRTPGGGPHGLLREIVEKNRDAMSEVPTRCRPLDVSVIGAGLGGLTAAIALRRVSHNVTVSANILSARVLRSAMAYSFLH